MQLSWFLITWASLLCQAMAFNISQFISQIPDCSKSCVRDLLANSTCLSDASDIACLCVAPGLPTTVALCIRESCLPRDILSVMNSTSVACHYPVRDKHLQFDVLCFTLIAITGIAVALRIFEKLYFEKKLQVDDWLIVICFVSDLGNTFICHYGFVTNGFAQDAWRIGGDRLTEYLKHVYISQATYGTDIYLTKICILLFFLRIFGVGAAKYIIWGTIAVTGVFMAIFNILAIFQCSPISYFWTRWDLEHKGHCIGVEHLAWTIASVSIVLDFWMLIIPIFRLSRLQMKWEKKLAVILMFCGGIFISIVSIIRLQFLIRFGVSENPTWDFFNTACWSVVEVNVGIWCACLPDIRLLFLKAIPKLQGGNGSAPKAPNHASPLPPKTRRRLVRDSLLGSGFTVYENKSRHNIQDEVLSSTVELVENGNSAERSEECSIA